MDLLFSVSAENPKSTVKDSNLQEYYPELNSTMEWKRVKTYIRQATEKYLIPYLGSAFYDAMMAAPEEELYVPLIEKLRDALAYYTVYHAAPFLNIIVSESGLKQVASSDGSSQPTEIWRYKQLRWNALIEADAMMDKALQYIESKSGDEEFALWVSDSSAVNMNGTPLFPTSSKCNEFLNIRNSRKAFLELRPFLAKAEEELERIMSIEAYEELKEKIKEPTEDDKYIRLIQKARRFVAHWALNNAIPSMRLFFEGQSIVLVSSTDGMNMRKDAHDKAIMDLLNRTVIDTKKYRSELSNYLHSNLDTFTLFKEHGYVEGIAAPVVGSSDEIGGFLVR